MNISADTFRFLSLAYQYQQNNPTAAPAVVLSTVRRDIARVDRYLAAQRIRAGVVPPADSDAHEADADRTAGQWEA